MAKKQKTAIAFVIKADATENPILFAVAGMPERTTAPKETAHYILYSGNKNKRYKMKINSYTTRKLEDGTKVYENVKANFADVAGKRLEDLYAKCCPAFKETFPLK